MICHGNLSVSREVPLQSVKQTFGSLDIRSSDQLNLLDQTEIY